MMDMHAIDVTGIEGVEAEDEVTLIGEQGDLCLSVDEVASRAGTISYGIFAGLMARVPASTSALAGSSPCSPVWL
jgi:alanine racemase